MLDVLYLSYTDTKHRAAYLRQQSFLLCFYYDYDQRLFYFIKDNLPSPVHARRRYVRNAAIRAVRNLRMRVDLT